MFGRTTLWKFWGLPQDRTAQHVGEDVLAGVPAGSLVVLGRDTILFTTQYVRYAEGYRPDTIVLHGSFLGSPEYRKTVTNAFPLLTFPSQPDRDIVSNFLTQQTATRRVFSNIQYTVAEGWFWVPYGLVFELIPKNRLPETREVITQNDARWKMLNDPTNGILSRYNHLMLSDVRDVYAGARMKYGRMLLQAGKVEEAKQQFEEAIRLDGDTQLSDAYAYKGITHLFLKQCEEALAAFAASRSVSLTVNADLSLYEGITYRDCVGNEKRAAEVFAQYEALQKEKEIPLEQLQ